MAELQTPPNNLDENRLGALIYYTAESPSKTQKNIYELLNVALHFRTLPPAWFDYLSHLLSAFPLLPQKPCTVYRGLQRFVLSRTDDDPPDWTTQYIENQNVIWVAVTSCSQDSVKADSFMQQSKNGKSFVTIHQTSGKDLGRNSFYGDDEKEILLPPNSVFKVLSAKHLKGVDRIELQELTQTEISQFMTVSKI